MSGEIILILGVIVVLAIIIPLVTSITFYNECQRLYAENKMLRHTIEAEGRLDELAFSAQQAMINEALRASRNNN